MRTHFLFAIGLSFAVPAQALFQTAYWQKSKAGPQVFVGGFGSSNSTTLRSVATFNALTIGAPARADRLVIVSVQTSVSSQTGVETITVNGAALNVHAKQLTSGTTVGRIIGSVLVPTGSTVDIVVNKVPGGTTGMRDVTVSLLSVIGLQSTNINQVLVEDLSASSPSILVTGNQVNDVVIGFARAYQASNQLQFSWTGLTETHDFQSGNTFHRHSMAYQIVETTSNFTVSAVETTINDGAHLHVLRFR